MTRDSGTSIERWLFDPVPIQPLVIARVVFGFVIFFCHLARLPDLMFLYGTEGLAGPRWFPHLKPYKGNFDWDVQATLWLERVLPPLSNEIVVGLYVVLLVASLCFALGFRTRTAGIVALLVAAWFVRARMPFAYWGWARFMQPLMLYVILAPTGRFLSVDGWLRRRRTGEPPPAREEWVTPAWPLRLLQVHVCTMYAVAGMARLDDLGWLRGQTVFNALANAQFSKLVIDWQPLKPLLAAATWATLALEPLAPLMLWLRRVGPIWAYALMALHLGLELATNVGWWNFVMIASLSTFVPMAHLDRVLALLPGGPVAGRQVRGA